MTPNLERWILAGLFLSMLAFGITDHLGLWGNACTCGYLLTK